MEFFAVLLGLIILAFPIIAIVALVKSVGLNDRLRRLELRFTEIEGRLGAGPVVAPSPASPPAAAEPAAPPPPPLPPEPEKPAAPPPERPELAAAAPAAQPAAPQISFEERFGTRWVVWVGGVALALGGIFLVRYSIEAGLIGPKMRLFFGALLAAGLIAAGEWTRRQEALTGFAGLPTAHIPSILTAAGTTIAYATVYAAFALYGFLSPAFAFVLLGIVALATLAAALLHGPALAALGLVGAYVTPLLVSTGQANYWALYIYLAVVTAAAFALANYRLWLWLAVTALAFNMAWLLPGLDSAPVTELPAHVFHMAAGFILVAIFIVAGLLWGPHAEPGKIDGLSSIAVIVYVAAAALFVLASRHHPLALTVFTTLTVAALAVAWRTETASAAVPVAAVIAALVIGRWAFDIEINQLTAPPGRSGGPEVPMLTGTGVHLALGTGFAVLFGATGFLAQGRSVSAIVPMLWSGSAVLGPILILIALYYRVAGFERSIPFAGVALLAAALYGIATETLSKREPRPGSAASEALFATGAVAALALALTFALERGWLTVALALMVSGIAWISQQRPLPMLRALAATITVLVALRIGWDPRIAGADVGTTPIFNWILYGYGIPAASFWYAGWMLRRRADDRPTRVVESAAILFTVLLVFLEIRHLMNGGDIYRETSRLAELALHACTGLAMTIGLEHVRRRTGSIVHDIGALIVAALTFIGIVFGLLIAANPMITGERVGGMFFNLILLGYGLPAVLAIMLALTTRDHRPMSYRWLAAALAFVLSLAYLTLQVRTLYHGPVLAIGPTSNAEQYTYSVVWLAYAMALLLAGIYLRSQPARLASAAVTALAVAKVFLIDMADLTGVWRALSFIGLGLVLVSIGWLYQRLLFPRRPINAEAGEVPAS
jgi:uncharacterized membrane protein